MTADTLDVVLCRLKENYDGYYFSWDMSQSVFNSWSLLMAFKSLEAATVYVPHWAHSGSFSMVAYYLKQMNHQESLLDLLHAVKQDNCTVTLSATELSCNTDLSEINPALMLNLTGFLSFNVNLVRMKGSLGCQMLKLKIT